MYVSDLTNKSSFLICLLTVLCSLASQVSSFRNTKRSVQVCSHQPDANGLHITEHDLNCDNLCSWQFPQPKYNKVLSYIKKTNGPVTCCCVFDEEWPKFIEPKLARTSHSSLFIRLTLGDCMPLAFSVKLGSKTKESYATVCRILKLKEPPTMLDLLEFAEAAAHLNYMHPKHPAIIKTLKMKHVARIDLEVMKSIKQIVLQYFLDPLQPPDRTDGFLVSSKKVRFLSDVMNRDIKPALGSGVVSRAFDEYIISYSIMDIKAAHAVIQDLNTEVLHIPDHLLENKYDSYDKSAKENYFLMDELNCKLLSKYNSSLNMYLTELKRALDGLTEKLIYDKLAHNYDSLQYLESTKKIYKELMKVNCNHFLWP